MSDIIVIRINIPVLKLQKAMRVKSSDLVFAIKKQVEEKTAAEIRDVLNYGLYLHSTAKKGKFLDEKCTLGSYAIDGNSTIDFLLKCRVGAEVDTKKQKKLLEDVQKGNIEKVKEKTTNKTELNFTIEGEGYALKIMQGDKYLWKTPLHLAAVHNKTLALKTLIEFGASIDLKDTLDLAPLNYAAIGGNSECVLRLLLANADTEILDEHGRSPLHQAALNNFDCIVALLIDFGANIHLQNIGGNTPLHVAASRNSKESTKCLLLRNADTNIVNKSGKKPYDVAMQATSNEVCDIIAKFKADQSTFPPTRYFPDSVTEHEGIVQNMLASLSSSIGKEYTPLLYHVRPPNRSGQTSLSRKPLLASDDSGHSLNAQKSVDNRKSIAFKLPPPPIESDVRLSSEMLSENKSNTLDEVAEEEPPSPLSSNIKLDLAWRRISTTKVLNLQNLRKYLLESPDRAKTESPLSMMLLDIDEIEKGVVKAVDEWDDLKQQNALLLERLKVLEASM